MMRGFRRKCGVNWLVEGTKQPLLVDNSDLGTNLDNLEFNRLINAGDYRYTEVKLKKSAPYFDKLPEHWSRVKPILLGDRS